MDRDDIQTAAQQAGLTRALDSFLEEVAKAISAVADDRAALARDHPPALEPLARLPRR